MKLKRKLAQALALGMMLCNLPFNAFAAGTIPINIHIYDESTGRIVKNYTTDQATYDENSPYIQSDWYTIPSLDSLTDYEYGSVTKVTGNWYTGSHEMSEGGSVQWSKNTGTKSIYYYVTNWQPGTGSGSANSGTGSGNVTVGETGNKNWTTTIVYHSNYPDGTDKTFNQTYALKAYTTSTNGDVYAYSDSPLNWTAPDGYDAATGTLPDGTRVYPWNTSADGSGKHVNKTWYFTQGEGTVHLYAQWVPKNSEIAPDEVKLTHKDGSDTHAEHTYFSGDTATTVGIGDKQDLEFQGWDTDESADNVVYEAGDGFEINQDTTVWAVWGARAVEDTIVISYDANGGTGAPEGEDTGVAEGEEASHTVSDAVPTNGDKIFLGWSTVKNGEVEYEAGDELKATTDTILYAVWQDAAAEEPDDDNDKVSEPGMDKKGNDADQLGTVEPGDSIEFTLNSHVGEDITDSVSFDGNSYSGTYDIVFKDTLTGPIAIDWNSFTVTVDGAEISDIQYDLDNSPADGSSFNLTIDVVALLNSGDFDYSRSGIAEVVVTYSTTVNNDAADGAEIRNDAQVNGSVVDTVTGEVENEEEPGPGTDPDDPINPPQTGGIGAIVSSGLGLALIGTSGIMFKVSKKKEDTQE